MHAQVALSCHHAHFLRVYLLQCDKSFIFGNEVQLAKHIFFLNAPLLGRKSFLGQKRLHWNFRRMTLIIISPLCDRQFLKWGRLVNP